MKKTVRRISALLLVALLCNLLFGSVALAQDVQQKAVISVVQDSVVPGERARIELDLSGFDDPVIDYAVKKPGAENYTYLKKDTTMTALNYKVKSLGEFSVKAIVSESDGSNRTVSNVATFTVVEGIPADAVTHEVLQQWQKECNWSVAQDLPEIPLFIDDVDSAVRAIELSILSHMDSYIVFAKNASDYFSEIGEKLQHTAFLKDGVIYYGISGMKGSNTYIFTVYPVYDEAGVIVRHLLYGDTLNKTMLYRDTENKIQRVTVDATEFYEDLEQFLSEILTADMTEFERVKAIHDALVKNYRYDMRTYDSETGRYDLASYSALGLYENGYGVCEGYAELFETLCLMAGVPCMCVTGQFNGGNHMWNLVKVGGQWYHVDVTSDDPVPDRGDSVITRYFLRSDEFMRYTHTWREGIWPVAPAEYQD